MPRRGPLTPEAVTEALSSKPSRLILSRCIREPRSAKQVEVETGLPLASVYRVIRQLQDEGLLIIERSAMTPDGKNYDLYRSPLRRASLAMDASGARVTWDVYHPVEDRLMNMWEVIGD